MFDFIFKRTTAQTQATPNAPGAADAGAAAAAAADSTSRRDEQAQRAAVQLEFKGPRAGVIARTQDRLLRTANVLCRGSCKTPRDLRLRRPSRGVLEGENACLTAVLCNDDRISILG